MGIVRLLLQTVALALGQLRANKARALLTALGIIIGVASVTAVTAGMTGMRGFVLGQFETLGATSMFMDGTIPRSMRHKVNWRDVQFQVEEVEAIREHCPSVETVSPHWWGTYEIRHGEKKQSNVRVVGIWPTWHEVNRRDILIGRRFSRIDEENRRYVCLINEKAIEELDLPEDPVGEYIYLSGRRFLVVGLVETREVSPMFGGGDPQTEVYVPFATARKLNPRGWINDVSALAVAPEKAEEARAEIVFLLRRMRDLSPDEEDTFWVEFLQKYIDQFDAMAKGITAVAMGVVSISLIVGGVGIMNIMLVSVSERTREIGLRKAVGARPGVIMTQFLVEAIALCVVGGLIGVALGQAITLGLQAGVGDALADASIPVWAIVVAIAFSATVGVVFGIFPAIKAARLDPIEALRHE